MPVVEETQLLADFCQKLGLRKSRLGMVDRRASDIFSFSRSARSLPMKTFLARKKNLGAAQSSTR